MQPSLPSTPPTGSASPVLRANDSLLHTLIMASPLAIFLLDLEERVQLWNPAAERIFGWEAEEVRGRFNPTVPEERRVEAHALMELILRGESVTEREVRRRRKDGTELDVGLAAARLCDDQGRPQGVMVIAGDITERRRLEEERAELLRRERRARAQAEAAEQRARFLAEASLLLDSSLDYHTTLRNLADFTVPALADYCLIDELDGEEVRRVATAHARPERQHWLTQADAELARYPDSHPVLGVLRTGQPVLAEDLTGELLDAICRDDEVRRKLVHDLEVACFLVVPLVARGRTLGTLTLASAESGRRFTSADVEFAAELARRAASAIDTARLYHQARQAVRARERLLAVVSHDLRNSLATVLLNASAMLDNPAATSLAGAEQEQLRWIARSTEQMSRLINDLLDVSTIEARRLSIEPLVHDPAAVLREAQALVRPLADEKELRVRIEVAEGTRPIRVDYERIQQVLANLLGNAVKFSSRGGTVVLLARPEGADEVRITVSDAGPGISGDDVSSVFDLFWQGRSDRKMGAGLGLAIARGIVETHGGRIWVESRPGEGSDFHFTVPAAGADTGREATEGGSGTAE